MYSMYSMYSVPNFSKQIFRAYFDPYFRCLESVLGHLLYILYMIFRKIAVNVTLTALWRFNFIKDFIKSYTFLKKSLKFTIHPL